jgi:hypothetical protein
MAIIAAVVLAVAVIVVVTIIIPTIIIIMTPIVVMSVIVIVPAVIVVPGLEQLAARDDGRQVGADSRRCGRGPGGPRLRRRQADQSGPGRTASGWRAC